jgi:hypothetical protein
VISTRPSPPTCTTLSPALHEAHQQLDRLARFQHHRRLLAQAYTHLTNQLASMDTHPDQLATALTQLEQWQSILTTADLLKKE